MRIRSSLHIFGITHEYVVFKFVVLSLSLCEISLEDVFKEIGNLVLRKSTNRIASFSQPKNMSTPPSTYSVLAILSNIFCFSKTCSKLKMVFLWVACCRIWTRAIQSWGVNFFRQSLHCTYFSTNYTTSVTYIFIFWPTSLLNTTFNLNLLEWGSVQTKEADCTYTLFNPLIFFNNMANISWLSL